MSNGEVFIVAKPRFDTNAAGQNELSIVDVWIVPDTGQGVNPSRIDDRGGRNAQPRCGCEDARPTYQTSRFPQPFQQHMTLVRTPQGWQIQYDVDPRLQPADSVQTSRQYLVDSRRFYQVNPQSGQYMVDPRLVYRQSEPRVIVTPPRVVTSPDRVVIPGGVQPAGPGYWSAEPRTQYQDWSLEPRTQYTDRSVVPRTQYTGRSMEARTQYQDLSLEPRTQYTGRSMEARTQYPTHVPSNQFQDLDAREQQNRRLVMQARQEQQEMLARRAWEAEQRRAAEAEQRGQGPRYTRQAPGSAQSALPRYPAPPAVPQSRARYGIDPGIGRHLDQMNQQDRRDIDRVEGGFRPLTPGAPQSRARYGVNPGQGSMLSDLEQNTRREVDAMEGYYRPADRTPSQGQRPPAYIPRELPTDSTRWSPNRGSVRTFEDHLDFDKDGKLIKKSVGDYLGKYGPAQRPPAPGSTANPNGMYAPQQPLSIPGMIQNGVDSSLRQFGDYLRGR